MRKILDWTRLNGKIGQWQDGMISPFDRGYLYGEGVFTTIKVLAGVPLFIERHCERLRSNAGEIGILFPAGIEAAVRDVIRKNELEEGGIRITITGGNSLDENQVPTLLVHAFKMEDQIQNIDVITVSDYRDIYKSVKSTYRGMHIFAQKKARDAGCQDALFSLNGRLVESTYANIFGYSQDKKIITPPIAGRGLNGITRQILMEKLPVAEEEVMTDTKASLVLVNSLGLRAVGAINGRKLRQDAEFEALIRMTIKKAEDENIGNEKM